MGIKDKLGLTEKIKATKFAMDINSFKKSFQKEFMEPMMENVKNLVDSNNEMNERINKIEKQLKK